MKSANQLSDSGLNSTSFGQAPGRSGDVHNIMSANEVTSEVASEAKAPTFTPIVERDRSNKGEPMKLSRIMIINRSLSE
ncbi:hypothetical protein HanIR_Chr11g0544721 [Helianthus annuus]|nr:hypothetical protein HanIR_Chr11g0544721 [Helianthus annuus]